MQKNERNLPFHIDQHYVRDGGFTLFCALLCSSVWECGQNLPKEVGPQCRTYHLDTLKKSKGHSKPLGSQS